MINDLGFAKKISYFDKHPPPILKSMGYAYITAPELFYQHNFNQQSDIWSLGVILYILLYQRYPWPGQNVFEYFAYVTE